MESLGEIRRNPFTGDYIIVNERRLLRPIVHDVKAQECPFCPHSTNKHPGLPEQFDAIAFENRFPALELPSGSSSSSKLDFSDIPPLRRSPNWGRCEVVLYSDKHEVDFQYLPIEKAIKVTLLWQERFQALSRDPRIKYVFIFENHGKDVGVTIFHPHGQIYALPFIPSRIDTILKNCRQFHEHHGQCLQCRLLELELEENTRIITENDHFVSVAPFHATLPHEIHVIPKRHVSAIDQFSNAEIKDFTLMLQDIRRRYDRLFDQKPAPNYMMMLSSKPVNVSRELGEIDQYFHFRTEFVSLDRDSKNLKYRAAVETGLSTWTNDLSPETVANIMKSLQ